MTVQLAVICSLPPPPNQCHVVWKFGSQTGNDQSRSHCHKVPCCTGCFRGRAPGRPRWGHRETEWGLVVGLCLLGVLFCPEAAPRGCDTSLPAKALCSVDPESHAGTSVTVHVAFLQKWNWAVGGLGCLAAFTRQGGVAGSAASVVLGPCGGGSGGSTCVPFLPQPGLSDLLGASGRGSSRPPLV